jgi:hypothetical protein
VNLSISQQLWCSIARDQFPLLSEAQVLSLFTPASSDWWHNEDTKLAKLFEQYVMLKTLTGNKQ